MKVWMLQRVNYFVVKPPIATYISSLFSFPFLPFFLFSSLLFSFSPYFLSLLFFCFFLFSASFVGLVFFFFLFFFFIECRLAVPGEKKIHRFLSTWLLIRTMDVERTDGRPHPTVSFLSDNESRVHRPRPDGKSTWKGSKSWNEGAGPCLIVVWIKDDRR